MTCRDEILDCAERLISRKGRNEFSLLEILECMHSRGTSYRDSTIRTHVTSRMCANAPDHHGVTYDDLQRIGTGMYRLLRY